MKNFIIVDKNDSEVLGIATNLKCFGMLEDSMIELVKFRYRCAEVNYNPDILRKIFDRELSDNKQETLVVEFGRVDSLGRVTVIGNTIIKFCQMPEIEKPECTLEEHVIPKPQTKLLKDTIRSFITMYKKQFEDMIIKTEINEEGHRMMFDLSTLSSILNYEITFKISEKDRKRFCAKHGVDFPEYVYD